MEEEERQIMQVFGLMHLGHDVCFVKHHKQKRRIHFMMKEYTKLLTTKYYVLLKFFEFVVRSDKILYNKKVRSLFLRDSHSSSGHCSSLHYFR